MRKSDSCEERKGSQTKGNIEKRRKKSDVPIERLLVCLVMNIAILWFRLTPKRLSLHDVSLDPHFRCSVTANLRVLRVVLNQQSVESYDSRSWATVKSA